MPAIITYNNKLITTNPTRESLLEVGSYRSFSGGIDELNNIPQDKRKSGMLVSTNNGTRFYVLKPSPWTQTSIDWQEISIISKEQELYFSDHETPIGVIDNRNKIFQLEFTPIENSAHVFLNGILQTRGETSDYTIDGNNVIFNTAPTTESKIICSYRYHKL